MFLLRDFRYALRALWQSPGFSLISIAVLALGIGANAAIFSVIYAVILKPLPYPDASQLVFVWQRFPTMPEPFSERMDVARRNYLEWQRQNTVFQEMGAFRTVFLDETRDDFSQRVATSYVSASLFDLLGIQPRLGRLFARDEERPGRNRVAILTDRYFDRTFHRDRSTLGKSVTLDGRVYTIIGVLPASFDMPHTFFDNPQPDLIVPLPDSALKADDNPLQVVVVARLHRGVSLQQARTEMAGIAERLKSTDREFYELGSTSIFSFAVEGTHPRLHRALYLLLAAATFLLLIACANLANLTLSRAALRSREIMVRVALGATRGRILTQLVSESLLVSFVGAAFGVMLAHWSLHLVLAFKPTDIHQPELVVINLPVLLFAASAAVLTTCLFGLWPALTVSHVDISSRLKAGGGWGASAARLRGRQVLIVFEVALALILLVGAGLMIRSLQELALVGVGFDITHLATIDVRISEKRNPDFSSRAGLVRRLIAHTQSIPGVLDAAVANSMPLHSLAVAVFHIRSQPELERDSAPIADIARVSPGFFQVIRLRLAAGRWLTDSDLTSNDSPKEVAMVNQAFARKYFPRQNPLHQRLQSGDRKENFEIVGVVEDF
ncbi:MAG TPA: ABC transporter permease, partial [Phototrophicaceae bacterium]|nr:ABC transporter permease [Phototrophicaceae bacterium]